MNGTYIVSFQVVKAQLKNLAIAYQPIDSSSNTYIISTNLIAFNVIPFDVNKLALID